MVFDEELGDRNLKKSRELRFVIMIGDRFSGFIILRSLKCLKNTQKFLKILQCNHNNIKICKTKYFIKIDKL